MAVNQGPSCGVQWTCRSITTVDIQGFHLSNTIFVMPKESGADHMQRPCPN